MTFTRSERLFIDFHGHLKGRGELLPQLNLMTNVLQFAGTLFEPVLEHGIDWFARYGRHPWLINHYQHFKHLGFTEMVRKFNRYQAQHLLDSMDYLGIESTVICVIEPFFETFDLLETLSLYPDRFNIFCSVDPLDPGFAEKFAAYMDTGVVRGLKIHPALAGPKPVSERMFELIELAKQHHLPVIIHTGTFPFPLVEGTNDVRDLEYVIRDFPDVPIVLAHIGWDQYRYVLRLGHDYPNVYTDTSWQTPHVIREAITAMGITRVLFGSDYPLFSQSRALGILLQALQPEELNQVGYRNAQTLLNYSRNRHG